MKKTSILCLLLMTSSLTFAQNNNPFMDPEIAPRLLLISEATTLSNGSISLYVSITENKKDGIR